MYCKPLFFRQYLANFKSVIFGKFHTITIEVGLQYMGLKTCYFNAYTLILNCKYMYIYVVYIFATCLKSTIYNVYLWNIIACINSLARFFLLLAFNLMIHCTYVYEYHIGKTYCLHISYLYRLGKHPIA